MGITIGYRASYRFILLDVKDFPFSTTAERGASLAALLLGFCSAAVLPFSETAAPAVTLPPPKILPRGMSVTYREGLSRLLKVDVLEDDDGMTAELSLRPAQIFKAIDNIEKDSLGG